MGSGELGVNLFRIISTHAKLKKDKINTEKDVCDTYYMVGLAIRNTIRDLGWTVSKEIPTPDISIRKLEQEELKKINGGMYVLLV
ncbi:putative uncharacterized protein [Mycoplasma sp. CAG:776]|nr:putative uncharacterized protein [Mycoplasma sp. CAG:776]